MVPGKAGGNTTATRIVEGFLKNHPDPQERPVYSQNTTTNISITFTITEFIELVRAAQNISTERVAVERLLSVRVGPVCVSSCSSWNALL